jgi:hypothetical protein
MPRPCHPFVSIAIEREDPPGSGSGWTTDDITVGIGTPVVCRAQFIALPDPPPQTQACVTEIHFEMNRGLGAGWTEWASAKLSNPNQWYERTFIATTTAGMTNEIRVRIDYFGEQLSSTFNIIVPPWIEQTKPSGSWTEQDKPAGSPSELEKPAGAWTEQDKPSGSPTELEQPVGSWTEQMKASGSWTEQTKASGSWTEQDKPSGTWTEQDKPAGSWTEQDKPAGTWTKKGKPAGEWTEQGG